MAANEIARARKDTTRLAYKRPRPAHLREPCAKVLPGLHRQQAMSATQSVQKRYSALVASE